MRIVVEGGTIQDVDPLVKLVDRQVALGSLGHLLVGGHKTRGAGAGRWQANSWVNDDVTKAPDRIPPKEPEKQTAISSHSQHGFIDRPDDTEAWVKTTNGTIAEALTLGGAARLAKAALGEKLVAWWCDPTIDLDLDTPPATFGATWPSEDARLQVDEVAFYAERAVWRAARTSNGPRFVLIKEVLSNVGDAKRTDVVHTPARLHGFKRFTSNNTGEASVLLREWHVGDEILGFTITKEQR